MVPMTSPNAAGLEIYQEKAAIMPTNIDEYD